MRQAAVPNNDVEPTENLFLSTNGTPIFELDALAHASWTTCNCIVRADARVALAHLPTALANTIVTSPPYYGHRDYAASDQIGSEDSPEDYITHLVAMFREARRVLRDDGTLWLNIGDKYFNKQLLGLPWRVALALVADGWALRSDIIWHKPNAVPASITTRPTVDHEYIFLLSKPNCEYYYDADSIREPHVTFSSKSRMRGGRNHFWKRGSTPEAGKNGGNQNLHDARWDQAFHPLGRNKRTVWEVPLSKFRGAHFAVFPEKLIEPCILAGSPRGGVILDPFFGSGTTGVVALNNGRRFVGVDVNPDYCALARGRLVT